MLFNDSPGIPPFPSGVERLLSSPLPVLHLHFKPNFPLLLISQPDTSGLPLTLNHSCPLHSWPAWPSKSPPRRERQTCRCHLYLLYQGLWQVSQQYPCIQLENLKPGRMGNGMGKEQIGWSYSEGWGYWAVPNLVVSYRWVPAPAVVWQAPQPVNNR